MNRYLASVIGASVALLAGCSPDVQRTSVPPNRIPVPPALSINAAMVGLVDHAGHALWQAEREGHAPRTIDDWQELEDSAVQLASGATVIALGGAGPADAGWANLPDWRTFSRQLRDAALRARTAAQSKNLEALVKANGDIVDACEACHKAFKPQLPTEKIVHRHRGP